MNSSVCGRLGAVFCGQVLRDFWECRAGAWLIGESRDRANRNRSDGREFDVDFALSASWRYKNSH